MAIYLLIIFRVTSTSITYQLLSLVFLLLVNLALLLLLVQLLIILSRANLFALVATCHIYYGVFSATAAGGGRVANQSIKLSQTYLQEHISLWQPPAQTDTIGILWRDLTRHNTQADYTSGWALVSHRVSPVWQMWQEVTIDTWHKTFTLWVAIPLSVYPSGAANSSAQSIRGSTWLNTKFSAN
jgi:hypothetical protein